HLPRILRAAMAGEDAHPTRIQRFHMERRQQRQANPRRRHEETTCVGPVRHERQHLAMVLDGYGPYTGDAVDPKGSDDTSRHVLRGGSFADSPSAYRAARRYAMHPGSRYDG